MLPIPVRRNDGSLITSVQDALEAYFEAEDVGVDWCCRNSTCGLYNLPNRRPNKFHRISVHPQVLVLNLVRWQGGGAGLLHAVVPELEISLQGVKYELKSIVCHLGHTINGGHYTSRIHFPAAGGTWWYYNDSVRRLATDEDMRTSSREKSYVLMYEKCSVASRSSRPLAAMGSDQKSVSSVESAPQSQPLIEEVGHVEVSATSASDSERDSHTEDIVMESPPEEQVPGARASLPVAASSGSGSKLTRSSSATILMNSDTSKDELVASRPPKMPEASIECERPRIVCGFGRERVDDVAAHAARLSKEEDRRAKQRYEEGLRGRMRDWNDNDLDRSGGSAWYAGRR